MKIDEGRCVRCRECMVYCPVEAIREAEGVVYIDQELCVECGVCLRSGVCRRGALYQPRLDWPRILRAQFSDPLLPHPSTGIMGRGTSEMKTNDVTGRFREGEVGFAVEMGRPGVSTSFEEVEKVTMALAGRVEFERLNPVTSLIDLETGRLRYPEVRRERALSAIIEFKVPEDRGLEILRLLEGLSRELETVFSLCIIGRCRGFEIPFRERMVETGFQPRINGKTNVGLGRPLA